MTRIYALDEYQGAAAQTAKYPSKGDFMGLAYATLGLTGESGEVAENVKKLWRDDGKLTPERTQKISKELGDVLWYLAQTATELDLSLSDIATENIAKLHDRIERGVLKGDGDDR